MRQPLVSITMLTYNDERFIVETLESVKAQTYPDLELVISDDKSQDNTVAVAKAWVEQNRSRFRNVVILESEENVGVTANCIRTNNAATGEWLKGIGGDNLMTPDCIEQLINFVADRPDVEMVQCGLGLIDLEGHVIGHSFKAPDAVFHDNRITGREQYQIFLRKDPVDALAMFKKKELLTSMECYDTEFRNQEDTPFALRILKEGHKIWYYPKTLVLRRMRPGSLSGLSDGIIVPKNMMVRLDIDKKYILPEVSRWERIDLKYRHKIIRWFYGSRLNKKTRFSFLLWKLLVYPANYYWRKKTESVKKEIHKSLTLRDKNVMGGGRKLRQLTYSVLSQRNPVRSRYFAMCARRIGRRLDSYGRNNYNRLGLVVRENLSCISGAERQQIIASADRTTQNIFNYLGSGDVVMSPVRWDEDFKSGYRWPKGTYYKKYVQVRRESHADVKVPRELSRSHFLLHLALAYQFTGDRKYVDKYAELVQDWIRNNPLMRSINWGCAMDVAIRAVNWIWSLSLLDDVVLPNDVKRDLYGSLYQHGWFIYRNLEGSRLRYNHNHYLSDLVGLLHIGLVFLNDKEGYEWFCFAKEEFFREVRLQVLPSGMTYERTTYYDRLVLELVTTGYVLLKHNDVAIPSDVESRVESMFGFVSQIMTDDGKMPVVGDQDDGRVLPWGVEALDDVSYLMALGTVLFGSEKLKAHSSGYNIYAAAFGGREAFTAYNHCKSKAGAVASRMYKDAGFAMMRTENDCLLFNADNRGGYMDSGLETSHTHCDWYSFVLSVKGVPFIIDPGTYVYSSDFDQRNLFRSTAMHNTVVVDGENQEEVPDAKLWSMKRTGSSKIIGWTTDDEKDVIDCEHSGYMRLDEAVKHRRRLSFEKNEGRWSIEDLLTGDGTHTYEAHFHLDEGVTAQADGQCVELSKDGVRLLMSFESDRKVEVSLADTFISKSYGQKIRGQEIIVSFEGECPAKLQTVISKKHYNKD